MATASSIAHPAATHELVFERPSRAGWFTHRVTVNPLTFKVLGCTCWAGIAGVVCWAALDVATREAYWGAWEALLRAPVDPRYGSAAVAIFNRANERRHAAEAVLAARHGAGTDLVRCRGLSEAGRVWLEVYEAASAAGFSQDVAQRQAFRHAASVQQGERIRS